MDNMAILAAVSVIVGFIGALSGLGGASILIPLLTLSGIPVKEAIASAVVCIIATSSGSAASFVKEHITNIKLSMFLEVFTITGAIIGASITVMIPPVYLYFLFAAFLTTSFLRLKTLKTGFTTDKDRIAERLEMNNHYFDESCCAQVNYNVRRPILGGFGMLIAGIAAGMLGIGAGAFKVTIQENVLNIPAKVASANSNFILGMTALASISVYLFSGLLNLTLMAPMAIGATIGAMIGSRVLNHINDRYLKILFYAIVVYVIVQMVFKGVASL